MNPCVETVMNSFFTLQEFPGIIFRVGAILVLVEGHVRGENHVPPV
jgi:hypothetical protein